MAGGLRVLLLVMTASASLREDCRIAVLEARRADRGVRAAESFWMFWRAVSMAARWELRPASEDSFFCRASWRIE